MKKEKLIEEIYNKKSMLCIGLDTDVEKLPAHMPNNADGMLAFNKAIIKATQDVAVCYKINTAFYESMGSIGWQVLEETLKAIPENIFTIADAKRGDIGNTAEQYRKAFFETMHFDALTLSPYMGLDSVKPYLQNSKNWGIVLGLTSNEGNVDIQQQELKNKETVSFHTMKLMAQNFSSDNLMFVVGATNGREIKNLRDNFPGYFFLVPGIGTQGGSMKDVLEGAFEKDYASLLINVSRDIIYSSNREDFAEKALEKANYYVSQMKSYFKLYIFKIDYILILKFILFDLNNFNFELNRIIYILNLKKYF